MKTASTFQLLPDPWFPQAFLDQASAGGVGAPASSTWTGANRAVYVPFVFPADAVLYAMYFRGTNATGNWDMGLYNSSFARMTSKGSTANANARNTFSMAEIRVEGGKLYYAAFVFSSASSGYYRHAMATSRAGQMLGLLEESSALPLPATATPVTDTGDVFPVFAFGVR